MRCLAAGCLLSALPPVFPSSASRLRQTPDAEGGAASRLRGAGVVGPPFVHGSILPCAPLYPLRPVYRVEQGPIHNVVVVPYEEPHLRLGYLPRRFFADCACYR